MKEALFVSLVLVSQSIFAAQWIGKQDLPYELKSLVESFNTEYLTTEESEALKKDLTEFDTLISHISASDNFFLVKSSVYKWVLQNPPEGRIPRDFRITSLLDTKASPKLHSFPKWLLLSLKSDTLDITKKPAYPQYVKNTHSKSLPDALKSIKKKVDLIRPWAYFFYRNKGVQLNLSLMRYQFKLLHSLIAQYKIFYKAKGQLIPQQDKNMKLSYFYLNDGSMKQNQNSDLDQTLSELDLIIKKHRKVGLPIPVDEWNLSKNDSWTPGDEEGEIILPTEDYTPPNELPKPVDDWGF